MLKTQPYHVIHNNSEGHFWQLPPPPKLLSLDEIISRTCTFGVTHFLQMLNTKQYLRKAWRNVKSRQRNIMKNFYNGIYPPCEIDFAN